MRNQYKLRGTKYIVIASLIQLISIPVLYWIGYGIGRTFHAPSIPGYMDRGIIDFYPFVLKLLTWFTIISIPLITIFREWLKSETATIIVHILWFSFIVWFTFGELKYRPLDYGLILICVGSTIVTRIIISRLIKE